MKKFKHFPLLLLAAIMVFGCSKYDDTEIRNDVSGLQSRVEKLEKWCETTNSQISALQGVVTALEAKDYVTGVSPITEGSETVGYTITFSKSGAVTIRNGANGKDGVSGVAPVIGVAKHTDNLYYWTVKTGEAAASWMRDAEGNMIRTTGDKGADGSIGADGKTPILSVATDGKVYWKVNGEWLLNSGNKVPATGDKGDTGAAGSAGAAGKDGDSIFKKDGIDLTDPNNVTFTLNDGKDTKIAFPRTGAVKIFDSFDNFKVSDAAADLTLSLNIKDADYKAIKAELTSSAGLSTAIKTRAVATPWQVAITAPSFKADGTVDAQPVVNITAKDAAEGDIALLKVTVIDSKGDEHASTRTLFYSTKVDVESVTIAETLALAVNEEQTLTATVLPAEAAQTVVWTTSDAAIATVNATTGEVEGKAEGEATITATATDGSDVKGTCKVKVEDKPSITWAEGNLVARADGSGCEVGTSTEGGLFFQFGSLIGWSSTGSHSVAISPVGYTGSTSWNKDWTGDPATDDAVTGTGDPCRYYLKDTWRLPTKDEYAKLFNNVTDGSYANSGGWAWNGTAKSATNSTKNLTFPASGYRLNSNGYLNSVGTYGYYWSATPIDDKGYILSIKSAGVNPSTSLGRAFGFPVRCVKDASN